MTATEIPDAPAPRHTAVLRWLWVVYAMILVMVLLGGITRLTGSGLSMTEWRPLMGWLPPLDEAAWREVFARYQRSPQYLEVNYWMDLAHFKRIFFWEYLHRLFGRLIGVAFLGPWLWLLAKKHLTGRLALETGFLFVLGGLQGLLGWVMVKSGLSDVPAVSHFRLAAHLGLAALVASATLWLALDLLRARSTAADGDAGQARAAWAMVAVVALQLTLGAFMAGTGAGHVYATFPTMNGAWIPGQAFGYPSLLENLFVNPFGIHFVHRSFGYLTAVVVAVVAARGYRRARSAFERRVSIALAVGVVTQIALGAACVLWRVPLALGVAHQAVGFVLGSLAVALAHAFGGAPYELTARGKPADVEPDVAGSSASGTAASGTVIARS